MSPTNQSHTYKIPLWVYDSVAFHSHVYVWASRRCTNDQDPELTGWEITLPKRCWVQDMLPAPLMWLVASCLLCGCNCSSGLWFQTLPPWERRTHTCTTLGFCPAGQSPHFQQLLMLLPVAGQTSKGGQTGLGPRTCWGWHCCAASPSSHSPCAQWKDKLEIGIHNHKQYQGLMQSGHAT